MSREPGDLPLEALRAFDAAARAGSFTAAAAELCVTPSAISHQIKTLERVLGAVLFQRQGRAILLSDAGKSLAPFVRQGLMSFVRGVAGVRGGTRARQIRLSTLALFNQTVLIPNLAKFSERWPQYDLRIELTPKLVSFDHDDVDVAIRVGNGQWPGLESTALLRIGGLPVATREQLTRLKVRAPADLGLARLIHDVTQPLAWSAWLHAQGVSARDESHDLWFDYAPALLQAAEQGLGVALAIEPLIYLWPGFGDRLVPAFPGLSGPKARYWLVRRPEADSDPKIRAFSGWVRTACRTIEQTASEAPTSRL
jgi:LysR family glycine cleavage system transcriptional activator